MRKLLFLLTIVVIFSCSSDNEKPTEVASIFGSWKLIDWYDDTPRDINKDGQASTNLFSQWNGCKKQSVLVLATDFTGKIVYTGQNNNSKCPPGFETSDFFTTETWKLDNIKQVFTLVGDDYFDSYRIEELTAETLILRGAGFFTCCDAEISYYTGGFLKFEKQ